MDPVFSGPVLFVSWSRLWWPSSCRSLRRLSFFFEIESHLEMVVFCSLFSVWYDKTDQKKTHSRSMYIYDQCWVIILFFAVNIAADIVFLDPLDIAGGLIL